MARDCRYELTPPNPTRPIRAVCVIVERGQELTTLYRDPEVIDFAHRQRIALMPACHCPSYYPDSRDGKRHELRVKTSCP